MSKEKQDEALAFVRAVNNIETLREDLVRVTREKEQLETALYLAFEHLTYEQAEAVEATMSALCE